MADKRRRTTRQTQVGWEPPKELQNQENEDLVDFILDQREALIRWDEQFCQAILPGNLHSRCHGLSASLAFDLYEVEKVIAAIELTGVNGPDDLADLRRHRATAHKLRQMIQHHTSPTVGGNLTQAIQRGVQEAYGAIPHGLDDLHLDDECDEFRGDGVVIARVCRRGTRLPAPGPSVRMSR